MSRNQRSSAALGNIDDAGEYFKQLYKPNKHLIAIGLISDCYRAGIAIKEIAESEKWSKVGYDIVKVEVLKKMFAHYNDKAY